MVIRSASVLATAAACTVVAALVGGCGGTDPAAPKPSTVSIGDSPSSESADIGGPVALWDTWKQLNAVCRDPSNSDSGDACRRRSIVQERQAYLVADAFFAAWKRGDTAAMAGLTHPDNAMDPGWNIPAKLASYRPTEQAFDCRYNLRARMPFGCYSSVTGSGASMYVTFELDEARGWLARSFRPDV